jgi:biopolymer transport protein ExbB
MLEYVQKGGPIMWLILACSIMSLGVFFERVLYFHRASIRVGFLLRGLKLSVDRLNFSEALRECAGTPGPVARVIHAALLRNEVPRTELKDIVQEAGQLEIPQIERNLTALATMAYLTPLIGLLGTITGLMDSFVAIGEQSGYVAPADISKGLYQSLLATAAGLAVSIPSAAACSYLSSRARTLMRDMERAGIEIVNMICDARRQPVIAESVEPVEPEPAPAAQGR